jgi:hypothetical protein
MNQHIIEARRQLVAERLAAIERFRDRAIWSHDRVGFPLTAHTLPAMDEGRAESLSAFIERFSRLQDLLGSTFREAVSLSGQPAEDYNLVLSAMEKAGVVADDDWRTLRLLRPDLPGTRHQSTTLCREPRVGPENVPTLPRLTAQAHHPSGS